MDVDSAVRVGIATRDGLAPRLRGATLAREYGIDLIILVAAYLVATYWRQVLPIGRYVGTNYEWYAPRLYLTIALGLGAAYLVRAALRDGGPLRRAPHILTFFTGIVLACASLAFLLPYQSGLQKIYFAAVAAILGPLVIPLHDDALAVEPAPPIVESLRRLWAHRSLLRIWVHYNVTARYTQAILGVLWIVLLPLSTALVMTIVFAQIMRVPSGNAPFISFFLAGYVPFGLFNQSISAGMRSILGAMGLINQIYFPREIIVLSALGEALVDTFFMFAAMLVINALVGVFPNTLFVFLPLIVIMEVALSLGLMFVVSWVSVLVRDIPQLVSVLLQIIFYLCPIIYPISIVPERWRFLIELNPLAVLVEAYRDIIVYDRSPDWYSLIYPAALGVALLLFGYRSFKRYEDSFADML